MNNIKRISAMLVNIEYLAGEVEDIKYKRYLIPAITSHCKRMWPDFTESEINEAVAIYFGVVTSPEEPQKRMQAACQI